MRNALLCATVAGLLAGCSLVSEIGNLPSPVAKTWPPGAAYAAPAMADASAVADLGWTEVFLSPDLRRLIAKAIDNNRDLRVAVLNVEAARAAYRVTGANLYPQLDASASRARARTPADLTSSGRAVTTSTYSSGLGVTAFELDFFGRLHSLDAQALEAFLATEEARTGAHIALVAEVANAWLTLQSDRRQLRLIEETLDTRQQSLDLIVARFRNGIPTQLDIAQARTSLETARVNLAKYTRALAQDRNALELLVGVPLREADIAEVDVAAVVAVPAVGVSSDVLLRRPDIREAEHQLRAANANIGAAKANRDIAVATYEKTIQTAFREVADALAARKTMIEQLAAQKGLVASSQEAFDLSQARYDRGISSYLDVLDSQRSLCSAQQTQIDLELAQSSNLVGLYKTLGGVAVSTADDPS